ncbi:hypothetical protein HKX54_08130 [Sulfitobacter sp. M57]|uniref:hypothetical protein n=1 Tax=unclassified Sulfitobacter TaxID=196795 RepID=UPI0023E1C93E|nr:MULTISPECIES: hypothetical protein [unclassified Sulfitobacter]MDF3414419.1 hypothetical protein [Sulfitobacter sp. KE5]MDF3421900.1 hypothetical protein [Sulfitobacter sp. KE43]MDF3432965.1 hypothetical protein [Sulfitobacter sp. KE42]MDF3458605.1 hypothetical protein [Sulfitobacter sp. S74]MDF3462505.1 hypothetical protein [Sulfitobacter sp. Ks18]
MPEKNYIIVGREVGEAKFFLHTASNKINKTRGDDGIPLTVAHIGKRVVEMSENGAIKEGTPEYERAVREIKYSLEVIPQGSTNLTTAEKEAIWENTTVQLKWDKRRPNGATDENTRIIVIPADNTHSVNVTTMSEQPHGMGFPPPLTYPLDVDLVFSANIDRALSTIDSFVPKAGVDPLSQAQNQALKDHIREELLGRFFVDPDEDRPEILSKQAVLEQQLVSYYRAVGIYITEMCK